MTLEARAGAVLSSEQRERFEHDGFLVLDDPCAPDLVDSVRKDAESLLHDAFDEGPDTNRDGVIYTRHAGGTDRYHWHRIREAWKTQSSIRDMALAPRVISTIEELFSGRALPFQTLNFPMGTEQGAHIDAFYFNSYPEAQMCGVWIALEDMDMDNGPLFYYPGSHKLPLPDWSSITEVTGIDVDRIAEEGGDAGTARLQAFSLYCQHMITEHGLEPSYGTIRKGQAVIWAANLLHGGSPQRDKSRTRHSQVTHYYFEGTRHYRPYLTERGLFHWSYPEWVRDPPPDTSLAALKHVIEEHVPAGSTVLIASAGFEELLDLDGRAAWPFPQAEDGTALAPAQVGAEAVDQVEQLRSRGAEYLVFPKGHLERLEYHTVELQNHLEHNYDGFFRDGAYGVIYALNGR